MFPLNSEAQLTDPTPSSAQPGVGRRQIVAGAAWTIPAIAFATATPSFAASRCVPNRTHEATRPLVGTSPNRASSEWTVPAGVTRVEYEVVGAQGGSDGNDVGRGSKVTGFLTVTPGQVLTLIVGQGGYASPDYGITATGIPGGQGFGNGGNSGANPSLLNTFNSGSGGGGSAILVGTAPIVVAGGGGGGGDGIGIQMPNVNPNPFTYGPRTGGNGGDPGGSAVNRVGTWTTRGRQITSNGGAGANGAVGGAGGATSTAYPVSPTPTDYSSLAGSAGGNYVAGAGGNGGNGAAVTSTVAVNPNNGGSQVVRGGTTGGGGGGGYAGGGGGGTIAVGYGIAGTPSVANPAAQFASSSGGGGGSSFVSPTAVGGVTSSVGLFELGPAPVDATTVRTPGSITLKYCAPTV